MKKLAASIRRVGLVANTEKPRTAALVRKAATILGGLGRDVILDPDTAGLCRWRKSVSASLESLASETDLILVFGGDGTMLRVARVAAASGVPILGVNAGHLGFLTEMTAGDLAETLARIDAGRFVIEERAMLEAVVTRKDGTTSWTALNDFVLSRGVSSRLIEVEVSVNGELLTRYRCDGLIASSPTGSTAYSLSAGGSIVSPDADVMVLTPICPHTLSIRPIVLSLSSTVGVRMLSTRLAASMTADGQVLSGLEAGDTVMLRRAGCSVRLLRPEGASFFSTLRRKFGWSGGKV